MALGEEGDHEYFMRESGAWFLRIKIHFENFWGDAYERCSWITKLRMKNCWRGTKFSENQVNFLVFMEMKS